MTQKEILENNKLIAGFMGGKFRGESYITVSPNEVWLPLHGICGWDTLDNGKTLKYHTSWDWLMPVFKEIGNKLKSFDNIIREDWLDVFNSNLVRINIKTEYGCVIDFIKWYNKNK